MYFKTITDKASTSLQIVQAVRISEIMKSGERSTYALFLRSNGQKTDTFPCFTTSLLVKVQAG